MKKYIFCILIAAFINKEVCALIYAIGGFNGNYLRTNEVYDPVTDSWQTKRDMPTPRWHFLLVAVNNKIYAIGGYNDVNGRLNVNEEYDPITDSWTTRRPMPTKREWLGGAVAYGKIYAIGGIGDGNNRTENEEYDPATDSWRIRRPMPTPRHALSCASVNNKIYAIGGTRAIFEILTLNEEYDPMNDTWTRKADMPTARVEFEPNVPVVNGKIYVIGGESVQQPYIKANEVYDPVSDSWVRKEDMPTARGHQGAAAYGGKIYIIGGRPPSTGQSGVNEEYDPITDSWRTRRPMPTPRRGLSCVSLQEGGETGIEFTQPKDYEIKLEVIPNIAKHSQINIKYTITNEKFELSIIDILGRHKIIEKGYKKPGNYTITFDTKKLTKGIYFIQLTTTNKKLTKKLLVI